MASPSSNPTAAQSWQDVCSDPSLHDLPYKIETNARGQIVMSPTHLKHGAFQSEIAGLLREQMPTGRVVTEAAVETEDGIKAADVAWFSSTRWKQVHDDYAASIAPEICVEVLSPANTDAEMQTRRALYFEAGADEVWLCDEEGALSFYTADGLLESSHRVPSFPSTVSL
ncbi:MAG: Uma2 family endonuclease [Longimonas sp.]|uniref:Uma2 family endonuclease n=1 Tax=Longimonas sp. TaxID=2039626 RepID=UPI00334DB9C1